MLKQGAQSLKVGSALKLEMVQGNVHYCLPVKLLGFVESKSLIVEMPEALSPLKRGDHIVARLVDKDSVFAFRTSVLKTAKIPFPYMHLSYPTGVQAALTRRNPRVTVPKTAINLSMRDGDEQLTVSMADVSYSGARLLAPRRLGALGATFSIDVRSPVANQLVSFSCTVRHVREESSRSPGADRLFHHGVEFVALSDEAVAFIDWLVREASSRSQPA